VARINHVSVSASDLSASTDFYVRLLGAVPIATPNFGFPVQWLSVGDTQLHLFQSEDEPTIQHHYGVEVDLDALVAAYRMAVELDALDDEVFNGQLVELQADVVQLYLRDPSGNLVELDAVGAHALPEDVRRRTRVLADVHPQHGEQADARLYIGADRPSSEHHAGVVGGGGDA
jgi:catechol 2,3-dioxygenase-like lactoylglutathione lyase family enzyme